MDSMLKKLEKYAENLESIVQDRTAQLMDEKQKTDMLLYRMLPPCALLINNLFLQPLKLVTSNHFGVQLGFGE